MVRSEPWWLLTPVLLLAGCALGPPGQDVRTSSEDNFGSDRGRMDRGADLVADGGGGASAAGGQGGSVPGTGGAPSGPDALPADALPDLPADLGTDLPSDMGADTVMGDASPDEGGPDGADGGALPLCLGAPADAGCAPTTCVGPSAAPVVGACDSLGNCLSVGKEDCGEYACRDGRCLTRCETYGDCAPGFMCSGGVCWCKDCWPHTCVEDKECKTGHCAQGTCCDSACSGPCLSCAQAGAPGTCTPIPAGMDPWDQCPATAAVTCGSNGTCDGTGRCGMWARGTICAEESCSGSTYTPASTCDGHGACIPSPVVSCAPYVCGASTCRSACSGDQDCVTGHGCVGGVCLAARDGGADAPPPAACAVACSADGDCASGFCVDGVCCDQACSGPCVACDLAGHVGRCTPVPAGSDPHDDCAAQPASSCGTTGVCNGAGACAKFPRSTVVAPGYCIDGHVYHTAETCGGSITIACDPYLCDAGGCKTSCSSPADCVTGYPYCVDGRCRKEAPLCTGDSQCTSGHCRQGVCCATACSGPCRACNLPGSLGTCVDVASGQDPNNDCADQGARTCGTTGSCDGGGSCRFYPNSTQSAAPYCENNLYTMAVMCDGSGGSVPGPTYMCEFGCATSGCKPSACVADSNCPYGYVCRGGMCNKPTWTVCSSAAQCASGFCVDGVCCNEPCTGTCRACNVYGHEGTCTLVPSGQFDPATCSGHCDCGLCLPP